jgi:hypothetical protein
VPQLAQRSEDIPLLSHFFLDLIGKQMGKSLSGFTEEAMDHPEDSTHDPEPFIMHPDNYKLRTMYKEDAIMELELGDRPFVLYKSARRGCLTIIYRRKDGEYAAMDINKDAL